MLVLDDLTTLALFVDVVELRSFTGAAKASGMAKASVSRRIAQLERRVGVPLLRRTTRQVVPTEEGKRLYERSVPLVAAAKEATEVLSDTNRRPSGVLRVAAPIVFTHRHLTSAVVEFLGLQPGIQLQVLPRSALVDLVADEIDVAIRIGNFSDSSFVVRRLATDKLVVVGSEAYLSRHGTPRTIADLEKHACLRLSWEAEHPRWRFRNRQDRSSLSLRGNLVATDGTVVRDAAILGLGLALLPSHVVADEVRCGRLTRLLAGASLPDLPISVVCPDGQKTPRRTRMFVDFLVERFSNRQWKERALLA